MPKYFWPIYLLLTLAVNAQTPNPQVHQTVQIATGDRKANIANVDGDVNISYVEGQATTTVPATVKSTPASDALVKTAKDIAAQLPPRYTAFVAAQMVCHLFHRQFGTTSSIR